MCLLLSEDSGEEPSEGRELPGATGDEGIQRKHQGEFNCSVEYFFKVKISVSVTQYPIFGTAQNESKYITFYSLVDLFNQTPS